MPVGISLAHLPLCTVRMDSFHCVRFIISAPEDHPAYQTILYYNQLRYRLMPYIYSLAGKTYFDDYTIMRPLVMDYASDLAVRDNSTQYMFGPSMMIAPVYTYKATSREVYFPKGTDWYDLYTGKRYKGGQKQEVEAPFERMPIFAPSGGILLYGPEITYVNEKKPEVIDVYIYAGKDGSFYLYEVKVRTIITRKELIRRSI